MRWARKLTGVGLVLAAVGLPLAGQAQGGDVRYVETRVVRRTTHRGVRAGDWDRIEWRRGHRPRRRALRRGYRIGYRDGLRDGERSRIVAPVCLPTIAHPVPRVRIGHRWYRGHIGHVGHRGHLGHVGHRGYLYTPAPAVVAPRVTTSTRVYIRW